MRPCGTTVHFVNDGIERALLVDEFLVAIAPVLLGGGVRLLDGLDPTRVELVPRPAPASSRVTRVRCRVRR